VVELDWGGERWTLLPERAVWWGARRAVVVADVHLGKAASFRAHGLPVPDGHGEADLDRLAGLVERFAADSLVILGDLLHARNGRSPETLAGLAAFRARCPDLRVTLVRGNHDAKAGDPPGDLGFEVVDEVWREAGDGPGFAHDPGAEWAKGEGPVMCGHLHPAVVLRGAAHAVRSPCFWFGARRAVLPAFGSFTGGAKITPRAGDRVFVVGAGEVVEAGLRPAGARG
jgi:uncharacterized protein